ncbi:helix-turn-helix transcriptional regulator [Providencia rettgeri]|uniref:helix-turn-helix transcriptional regulator n=1 Tax=Providencia rettgeri TaxID=587 RepID=UPI0029D64B35|nr:helix-turn-helix transcriptional regulator [Providencia rettgeri]MDX7321818.1 helix-turn-helix transcriptional regulator [Providencia rettgeri]
MGKESIAKMLGIKIRKQRENHKISIERMASLIGVTEEEMNRFETGEIVLMLIHYFNLLIFSMLTLRLFYMALLI